MTMTTPPTPLTDPKFQEPVQYICCQNGRTCPITGEMLFCEKHCNKPNIRCRGGVWCDATERKYLGDTFLVVSDGRLEPSGRPWTDASPPLTTDNIPYRCCIKGGKCHYTDDTYTCVDHCHTPHTPCLGELWDDYTEERYTGLTYKVIRDGVLVPSGCPWPGEQGPFL